MTVMPLLPTVLEASEIAALADHQLDGVAGVADVTLWSEGSVTAGILRIDAGHSLGLHEHCSANHHIWLVAGRARIAGVELGPGSYVHVPPGVLHDIVATDDLGCSVFYVLVDPAVHAVDHGVAPRR